MKIEIIKEYSNVIEGYVFRIYVNGEYRCKESTESKARELVEKMAYKWKEIEEHKVIYSGEF
jgi:hypothetical protein